MKTTRTTGYSRRTLLLAAGCAGLAGCDAPFGLQYGTIKNVLAASVGLEEAPSITLEQASSIPYSSIGYRIGKSSEGMLVLASQTGEELLWTSADRIAIMTRNGRIVKTGGLRWNLFATSFPIGDPLSANSHPAALGGPTYRTVDFNDVGRFSIGIRGQLEQVGPQTISILGSKLSTIAMAEQCKASDLDWEFQNLFWADAETGFIWKTVQFIHPNEPPITIEVLRPPA